ncbi:hypothetical protein QJS10_CPA16g01253 [Acorus calamus]|uniref:S1-like domain-containing protein n=1 Tax=Acorus calamus TaxID=4465 RepID=A0AAV9D1V1_ACOCL|nr:hypothetical protein QJS10_CPA16g01253 [Acorus calamus]
MPKTKGKSGKKRRKNKGDNYLRRQMVFKEDGQEYAQDPFVLEVLRMLGNCRCEAVCADGVRRLCHIRGKFHMRVWIDAGDVILDKKADIILRYMPNEAMLLKDHGELPENIRLDDNDDNNVEFFDCMEFFEDEDIDMI